MIGTLAELFEHRIGVALSVPDGLLEVVCFLRLIKGFISMRVMISRKEF